MFRTNCNVAWKIQAAMFYLVNWLTLEAHTQGFRSSAEYQTWRALLHHFYDPFPTVEHYTLISDGS